ncbi:MAG: hypothetical protein LBQ73_10170 [Tannerellaceae bacterium]|jgi:hypothetical protein|nr:hypothetical protein [Tannerellaceae bacterium]
MNKRRNKTSPPVEQPQAPNPLLWFVKNAFVASVVGILTFQCIEEQAGYHWVYNTLLKGNMKMITQYPNLAVDQKNEMKLGFDYVYLRFLKNSTPEDAVILYPSREDFFPEDKQSPFKQEINNKVWALRFLYPRKLVLPSEMETNRYAQDITHVAIVNGRGYERLNYTVDDVQEHGILPVNP